MQPKMTFARERLDDNLCAELMPLLQMHYQEVAHFKDIPLDPDFQQYIQLDNQNLIRTYIARTTEPVSLLTGYAIYLIKHNLHYQTSLQALQDVLFIHPDHRGFGSSFISWCDEELRKDKVEAVYHHIKIKHDFSAILTPLGYERIEYIYGRRLHHGN